MTNGSTVRCSVPGKDETDRQILRERAVEVFVRDVSGQRPQDRGLTL